MNNPRLRCAIYARKSTEEGLDQEFNSLDAQREACAAFVASQVGLGWKLLVDRYDDPGFSGGSMERPALQRLLQDIRDKKVDVVVVYKIDRLTRSLTDFSRIVEVFDQAGVSFVSVTQQFNTTTSMGRLTLNVLLSFAQFEREVTAERIRDKIAASKKKGMWMGGIVPLGYRVDHRKLVIHTEDARTVRWLFERYRELKSILAVIEEASKAPPDPSPTGGKAARQITSRGKLAYLLSNPTYVGCVRHRDKIYDGEHDAIIDRELFDQVQRLLKMQAPSRRSASNVANCHLLTGLIYDETGQKLRSVHANKKGMRYRYYVSQALTGRRNAAEGWRLPARQIEPLVTQKLISILQDRPQLADWVHAFAATANLPVALDQASAAIQILREGHNDSCREFVHRLVHRIALKPGSLTITIDKTAIVHALVSDAPIPSHDRDDAVVVFECPLSLKRRGVEMRMVVTNVADQHRDPDLSLVRLVLRAHRYLAMLISGENRTISDVAKAENVAPADISRILPLAFLSPSITDSILAGTQSAGLTAQHLSRDIDLPASWRQQAELLVSV